MKSLRSLKLIWMGFKQVALPASEKRTLSSMTNKYHNLFHSGHILPNQVTVQYLPTMPLDLTDHNLPNAIKEKNTEDMHKSGALEVSQTTVEPLKDSWAFVLLYFLHSTQESQT